jgi:hypothetical protein
MKAVWDRVNDQRRELLILQAYKDALSHATILDKPSVSEFELEDEPGGSLKGLEAYWLILAARERVQETDSHVSHNNNSVIEE